MPLLIIYYHDTPASVVSVLACIMLKHGRIMLKRGQHFKPELFPHHAGEQNFISHSCLQVIPTPLTRLHWWRVCLDEAQMVETSTAKAALMASRLSARHRWCITGTPLSRGLEDLYGLFFFLRAAPLHEKFWWSRVCQKPYEAGSHAGVLCECRFQTMFRPLVCTVAGRASASKEWSVGQVLPVDLVTLAIRGGWG